MVDALARGIGPSVVVRVACGDLEPTPAALTAALAARLGCDPIVDSVATALAAGYRCLVLDDAERLRLLDSWLRSDLLPALPASVTTLLVARVRPGVPWLTAPGWHGLVADMEVPPLSNDDAAAALDALGVDSGRKDAIVRFARGHPLALRLAAAVPEPVDLTGGEPVSVVVEMLVDRLLDGLPPHAVPILQAATQLRRVREDDLAGLLDGDGVPGTPHAWWTLVRDLPFATIGPSGLEIHELVRTTVQQSLAVRDPRRHEELRHRAVRVVRDRVEHDAPAWSNTADVLYLIQDPVVREGFFPTDSDPVPVEPAHAGDSEAIAAYLDNVDGPEAVRWVRSWLEAHPRSIRVARDPDGRVAGVSTVVELAEVDPWALRSDPVAAVWAAHLDRHRLRDGERALLVRRTVGERGEQQSPSLAALFIDVKRTYLELRPQLRRVYIAVGPGAGHLVMLERLGFVPIGSAIELGGAGYQALVLDFGPGSVDRWLAGLLDAAPPTENDALPPPLDQLTRREREVLVLVAGGATNKDVAAALGISRKTVGRHLENTFAKLGVTTRSAAAHLATTHGLTS